MRHGRNAVVEQDKTPVKCLRRNRVANKNVKGKNETLTYVVHIPGLIMHNSLIVFMTLDWEPFGVNALWL